MPKQAAPVNKPEEQAVPLPKGAPNMPEEKPAEPVTEPKTEPEEGTVPIDMVFSDDELPLEENNSGSDDNKNTSEE